MKNIFFTLFMAFLCFFNICRSEEATNITDCNNTYIKCVNELNVVYNKAIDTAERQNNAVNVISQSNQAITRINQCISELGKYEACNGNIIQLESMKNNYSALIIKYSKYSTEDFKSNGMARAICYVINIVTGTFGKAIASLFVILIGMSLLSGQSQALSFKVLMSVAIALALIFGSTQLANIISGNTYSCKTIMGNR